MEFLDFAQRVRQQLERIAVMAVSDDADELEAIKEIHKLCKEREKTVRKDMGT